MSSSELEESVARKVPFFQLCVLLDKISGKHGKDKKNLLSNFITEWRRLHNDLHKDKATKDSFYPTMRLLLPQLERERDAYGIKEFMLAKLYIDILGLGKTSPAAQKLLNFRAPKSAKASAGDFASVAFSVLQPRCPDKGSMSIAEVNEYLDKVAQSNTAKDKAGVKKSLEHMLRNMSAREQKWLIRIIMKELKVGISQQSVLSSFHKDAEDLFNVKTSLRIVCEMLHDPSVRLHEVEISLFSPFRPMLGDRAAPQKVEKLMNNKPFFIETKFDGERMQLHKKHDEYQFFSRSGNNYTSSFGGDPFSGTFTPFISNTFKPSVKSCILDGEMVGFNPETNTIGSKGQQFDVKSSDVRDYHPMMCVFDILMLNDQILSNKSLRTRKEALQEVFNELPGRLILSKTIEGKSKDDAVAALNEAIDNREEGIMVKDPESVYQPNMRKGGWYKVKPDYLTGLMDELDLLVVGGYFGVGHRSNLLSHFLCAVAVPPKEGDKPREFHSCCRVGSGYTRTELFKFNKKLQEHWQPYSKKRPPGWLHLASGQKQAPDCCIEPDKSVILQIRAAEINYSDQFRTECTLRFPRVEHIRTDKPWYQCMTTTELNDLRQKASGKLANKLVLGEDDDEDDDHPKRKKRKTTKIVQHARPTVMSRFVGADVSAVEKISEMFAGKELCVINGPSERPKSELEKKIVEYGGKIVQNPGDDTFCVLVDKVNVKAKNIMKKGKVNIVKADWFIRCLAQNKFIPWLPGDLVHMSPSTAEAFAEQYDEFNDSYFHDTTVEGLKETFAFIDQQFKDKPQVTPEDIAEIEMKYFPSDSPYGIFRLCSIYPDIYTDVNTGSELADDVDTGSELTDSSLTLVVCDLKLYGATVTNTLNNSVTHVLVQNSDTPRMTQLKAINRTRDRKFHIVSRDWVQTSIEQGKVAVERNTII